VVGFNFRFPLVSVLVWSGLFGLPIGGLAAQSVGVFPVRQFGAVPDGATLNTTAIQKTVDAASAAGGGTVLFEAGRYLSGTIVLKSNVRLQLEPGAVLLGSKDPRDFPRLVPRLRSYTDNYGNQSLIYGEDLENVAITGLGVIDGQGEAYRWREYRDRPFLIRVIRSRRVLVEGIQLRSSPMWAQQYMGCEDVRIEGIRVFNHATYNNDGIDIDGCRNVRISNCRLDTDDDALVLKSTFDGECRDVTVTNCVLSSHCNAFKLGTESNGGFRNITFSNSVIHSPAESKSLYGRQRGSSGVSLEVVDGGRLDQVAISNITIEGVEVPIFLRLGNRARPFQKDGPVPGVGDFRNVTIEGVLARGVGMTGSSITGLPGHPIRGVSLKNLRFEYEGGATPEDGRREVPEKEKDYPEATMFGVLPAYGLYCRHVEGLDFADLKFTTSLSDPRPALVVEDAREVRVRNLGGQAPAEDFPVIDFRGVNGGYLAGSVAPADCGVFLRVTGTGRDVSAVGNDLRGARNPFLIEGDQARAGFRQAGNLGISD